MTNKNIYRNLGNLDPALIAKAAPAEKVIAPKKNTWVRWASLAACLFLIVGAVIVVPMVWGNKSNVPPNMYDTLNIPAITVQVPSSAPQYYGNENSVSGTLSELVRGDGLSVTARLKDVLPDTYTFYDDWNQTEFRLLRMETIKLLKGKVSLADFKISVCDVFTVFVFVADFYMDTAIGVFKVQSVIVGTQMGICVLVTGAGQGKLRIFSADMGQCFLCNV